MARAKKLLTVYLAWLDTMLERRQSLSRWTCPECQHDVLCFRPSKGSAPCDTLTTCPYCLSLFWQVSYASGVVEISRPATETTS
ncbi:hypothetical protein [Hydrocarboniphaga effusa]|uniref:hypothetical protein n=1 Tax=Hydrocarboniphaga effusa TaxID=243629 RepID=UPI003BAA820B